MRPTTSFHFAETFLGPPGVVIAASAVLLIVFLYSESKSSLPHFAKTRGKPPAESNSIAPFPTYPPCGSIVVHNRGEIGKGDSHDLRVGCSESDPIYEGSFVLVADSNANGVVIRYSTQNDPTFVPNRSEVSQQCGIDSWESVPLGFTRTGGCPGTPRLILGSVNDCSYSDTLIPGVLGCPPAAGVTVHQTVTVADASPYNDFVLYQWEIINRDGFAKGPWYAGSYVDFDPGSDNASELGWYSDSSNGYVIWNSANPILGFGMFDPNQVAGYSGISPVANSPFAVGFKNLEACNFLGICPFFQPECPDMSQTWEWIVREQCNQSDGPNQFPGDRGGVLINSSISLAPHGSASIHQAMFWVDASTNSPSIIEANMLSLAKRAARWAGFARGDINDDGFVDLADVAWLGAGLPVYPDTYCGDVDVDGDIDMADISYLLDYVSGAGPAPQGEWRFAVPPDSFSSPTQVIPPAADTTNTR